MAKLARILSRPSFFSFLLVVNRISCTYILFGKDTPHAFFFFQSFEFHYLYASHLYVYVSDIYIYCGNIDTTNYVEYRAFEILVFSRKYPENILDTSDMTFIFHSFDIKIIFAHVYSSTKIIAKFNVKAQYKISGRYHFSSVEFRYRK